MHGLFVTGTDTEIGKTHVTCMIAQSIQRRGLCVGAYKPVCSGLSDGQPSDIDRLAAVLSQEHPPERICPQVFQAPVAPNEAAKLEGKRVNERLLRDGTQYWKALCDILLVEGAGGWLSPISEHDTVADVAADLGFPVIIVAASRLGTINHTLLTIESVRSRNLPLAGVIMNYPSERGDSSSAHNAELIRQHGQVKILGRVDFQSPGALPECDPFATIDWTQLAQTT